MGGKSPEKGMVYCRFGGKGGCDVLEVPEKVKNGRNGEYT